MIPCAICSVTLTGPADYQLHISGRRHRSGEVALQRLERLSVQDTPRPQQPPPRNQTRPRGGSTARTGPAHVSPRPQGPNPAAPGRSHSATTPNANGRPGGRAPRSQVPPARPRQAQSGEPNNSDARPPRKRFHVDFEVIRNTETQMAWKSCEFIPDQAGIIGRPTVNLAPIKRSRRASVQGFSLRAITRLPGVNGYSIEFGFNPRAVGRGVHVVVAHVTYPIGERNFSNTLKLRAIIGSPEDHQELQPTTPFDPIPREQLREDWQRAKMIQSKPPTNGTDFEPLPRYDITNDYWRAVQSHVDRSDESVKIHLRSLLPARLETGTYGEHWSNLLWHEEIAMCNQLKQYDMKNVSVPQLPGANKHSLTVPGLQEKRPSVIVSDLIAIRKPGSSSRHPVYGGNVAAVQHSDVILELHGDFSSIRGQLWDTRFTVNRLVLRRMHDAVRKSAPHFDRILFPESMHQRPRTSPPTRLSIDRRISTNPEQKLAIEQIVSLSPGDIPFVIFGPPGTGKTTVVVEAIHQVLKTNPDSHLLVCAPSNSAADLLGVRLSRDYNYTPRQLLRLNAATRSYDSLDIALRRYSITEGRTFKAPSKEDLMKFRIVVSTCFSASVPRALRIGDHFTHIFIDEAGHASEPEIMIPILQNASQDANIVLSGDPKQLGPIVQSKPCEALGMTQSFLERLTKRPVYQVGPNGTRQVRDFVYNYRNHPAILRFPNQVFYGGELQVRADPTLWQRLVGFDELPQPGFPIIFHSVCGENQREGKSPSYFNIDEATLVKHYVKSLLADNSYGLSAKHVGVITPYRQQCVKIRKLLERDGYGAVDVKVTEDWQGQERRVIIISTVRSDPELLEEGALTFLGFVASPRRMNVALTRAQALLIVIGNGHILMLDPFWNAFIRYVHASGGSRGDELYLHEQGFEPGQFSDLRTANRSYVEEIDNVNLWDVLGEATRPWNSSTMM